MLFTVRRIKNYFISADPKVKEELSPVMKAARKSLPKNVVDQIEKGNLKPFFNHLKTIASSSDIEYVVSSIVGPSVDHGGTGIRKAYKLDPAKYGCFELRNVNNLML